MKHLVSLVMAVVFYSAAAAGFGSDKDPVKIYESIREVTNLEMRMAHEANVPFKWKEATEVEKKAALKAIGDLDSKTIPTDQAYAWAKVFDIAEKYPDVLALTTKHLNSRKDDIFPVTMLFLNASLKSKSENGVLSRLAALPASKDVCESLSIWVLHTFSEQGQPRLVLDALKIFETKINASDAETGRKEHMKINAQVAQAKCFRRLGEQERALKVLDSLEAKYGTEDARLIPGYEQRSKIAFEGKVAPDLRADLTSGEFKGLEHYRGKVVFLDFFAYWCNPCLAGIPGLKNVYKNFNDKGFEVIGVTTYYGNFFAEKDLTKPQEYDKVTSFLKKRVNLPWPVVFAADTKPYGMMSLPLYVLIDKKGIVRKVQIGFNSNDEDVLTEEVRQLLQE